MAKLYFHFAAMNAGKSTVLLQSSFNYRERGMRTLEFTAAIDDRAPPGKITSRIGLSTQATPYTEETDFFAFISQAHEEARVSCVFVDEAQFLKRRHVFQLAKAVDTLNIPVICYGLRTDFLGNLFEGSAQLLAIADELKEIKTICECGRKATMNLRIDQNGAAVRDGQSIEIGGNDRYMPLCRKHFYERIEAG